MTRRTKDLLRFMLGMAGLLIGGLALIWLANGCALPGGHVTLINVDMRRGAQEHETVLETLENAEDTEKEIDVGLNSSGGSDNRTLLGSD